MLISVHLPKTAGTSFSQLLAHRFAENYQTDYDDQPLHAPRLTRQWHAWRGVEGGMTNPRGCIHGHFLPYKYRKLVPKGAHFVTWLREPVDRLRSHYDYWLRSFDPDRAGRVHRVMMEEQWSFERFALGPELRNIYALFLWRFPLERFSFVGIFEHLEDDLVAFEAFLDCENDNVDGSFASTKEPLTLPNTNRNIGSVTEVSAALSDKIRDWHALDVSLYEQALQAREHRR